MNAIHKILTINEKELSSNIPDHASWHADYSDTSYIYIGNLHESLAEKDILTIFSQYGNPTHINLVKDRESGKSRGFCYLKYEDQRSCVLAIDNFNGSLIYEKPLKVDHTYYRLAKGQQEDDFKVQYPDVLHKKIPKQIEAAPKLLPYENPAQVSETSEDITSQNQESPDLQVSVETASTILKEHDNDDDFTDPMAKMINNDDDFEDPMAGFVTKSSRKHESGSDRKSRREHGHRSKRPRHESTNTNTGDSEK